MSEVLQATIIMRNGRTEAVTLDGCELPGVQSAVINSDPHQPMSITLKIATKVIVLIEKDAADINGEASW